MLQDEHFNWMAVPGITGGAEEGKEGGRERTERAELWHLWASTAKSHREERTTDLEELTVICPIDRKVVGVIYHVPLAIDPGPASGPGDTVTSQHVQIRTSPVSR